MGFFWTTLLLCHLLPSLIHSLECSDKEYAWGSDSPSNPTRCCNKCKPGEYMKSRCPPGSVKTKCEQCSKGNKYTDNYNTETRCKTCRCGDYQMEVEPCSLTKNTECKCTPGYQCSDDKCLDCVEMDKTDKVTTSSQPPWSITTKTTKTPDTKEPQDAVLLPVVLTLCVCILLLIIANKHKKLKPLCCCTFDDLPTSEDTQSTEGEAVPVQEVCSDCQEVWIKDGLDKEVSERIIF